MNKKVVVLIAGTDYDNLGIGYLSAVLRASGIETKVIDFRKKRIEIVRIIKRVNPILVGFSILLLDHLDDFINLISFLRREGIKSHFTAGGHYASLKSEELFWLMPQIDSIVRFEGEHTLTELVTSIQANTDWKKLSGLAYIEKDRVIFNPLRPLEDDLDNFPFPARSALFDFAFGKKFATLIAGRGCVYQCSFCNTRKFYSLPPGQIKRIRKPEMVVMEMEYLYKRKHGTVFLFQDDDFPVKSKIQPDWVVRFCTEIKRKGLKGNVIWKINCRPDEVEEEVFSLMKNHGLYNVFLGIEDGTDIGLKILNKHLTVERTIRATEIIKKLGIDLDFGFILFQPMTTFRSLKENLDFLTTICCDGYTSVPFQKLLPLYETMVEKELMESGRLKVSNCVTDYDFLEKSMNDFFDYVSGCFENWMREPKGVGNLSKWARNYFSVYFHFFGLSQESIKIHRKIIKIFSESNLYFLDTMRKLAEIFETDQYLDNRPLLDRYKETITSKHGQFRDKIINTMAELVSLVEEMQVAAQK